MEKKTLSTALGFEPRSFDCRSTALIGNKKFIWAFQFAWAFKEAFEIESKKLLRLCFFNFLFLFLFFRTLPLDCGRRCSLGAVGQEAIAVALCACWKFQCWWCYFSFPQWGRVLPESSTGESIIALYTDKVTRTVCTTLEKTTERYFHFLQCYPWNHANSPISKMLL